MQSHLLVGPIPTKIDGSPTTTTALNYPSILPAFGRGSRPIGPPRTTSPRRNRKSLPGDKWAPLMVFSSSRAINGEPDRDRDQDHYAVLGLSRSATLSDIKRAYRLLARKYHPDVSKHTQAAELFKSIHHAYEILSNEVTRTHYDRVLRFREDPGRSYTGKQYYNSEFEDRVRIYRWDELRAKMQHERYWERYNVNQEDTSTDSDTDDVAEEGIVNEERVPFSEVLRSAFISLFLLQTLGSLVSLTFSSLTALVDRKLDAGYKLGYLIAWILGGRGGVLLTLCLQFTSWVCGKTSSSVVALVVVALWVGSNLARYAPLPPGALLALLYMSIKLQSDLN